MSANENKNSRYDLTEGSITSKLLFVSLPVIGTQIIQMTYNLTDMFWLGRVGSGAVAAAGMVGMYIWMSMAFLIIGSRGAEIGVSQNVGSGDIDTASRLAQTALIMSLIAGCVIGVVYIALCEPLIGFFNIREREVVEAAEAYMRIVSLGIPFNFVGAAVTGIFNGSGNAKTPFYINSIALFINIVLDPLFIFTFNMGISGAAIATVIAQAASASMLIAALLLHKHRPFKSFRPFTRPLMDDIRRIFRWTLPISAESFLFTFLSMLISRMITAYGADAIAAQRVGSQAESLSWLIAGGYSTALAAFTGQNYGAKKWERIRKGFRLSAAAMLVYGAVISFVMFFGAGIIFSIFLPDSPAAVNIGMSYLRILAVCQILACFEAIAAGSFRGIGKTIPPSVVSVTVNTIRVAAAYFLSRSPLGLNGIWIALSAGAAARGLWMFIWYFGKYRHMTEDGLMEA